MPSWLYYLLLASVFVALIIMVVATFWMVRRRKLLRARLLSEQTPRELDTHMNSFEAPQFGKLDLELKARAKAPLDDELMIFAINSFRRNAYQSAAVFFSVSDYEATSLEKFAEAKLDQQTYDFALVFANGSIYNDLKELYKKLRPGGMMQIVNLKPRSRELRTLIYDLKVLNYRYEQAKIRQGVIVIAK